MGVIIAQVEFYYVSFILKLYFNFLTAKFTYLEHHHRLSRALVIKMAFSNFYLILISIKANTFLVAFLYTPNLGRFCVCPHTSLSHLLGQGPFFSLLLWLLLSTAISHVFTYPPHTIALRALPPYLPPPHHGPLSSFLLLDFLPGHHTLPPHTVNEEPVHCLLILGNLI